MLLHVFYVFLGCLVGALSRDLKFSKPMPAITHSLVNFGKMDISFYLNDKFKDLIAKRDSSLNPPNSQIFPFHNDSPKEEACPCSSLRNVKDPFSSHPSEILNRILMSNDLFSFNKELISSTLCCDSHENIHEESVFFEFSPRQNQMLANPMPPSTMLGNSMLTNPLQLNQQMMPSLTRILDSVFPRRPVIPLESAKQPAVDIFLFPKKKAATDRTSDSVLQKKPDIHAVGDSELNKDIKPIGLTSAITNKTSVKKDLGTKRPIDEKLSDLQNDIVKSSTKM